MTSRSAEAATSDLAANSATSAPPTWVLLPLEARVRGFRNALAFRRWCRRHAVPIHKDGRREWICRAEVDRVVACLARGGADPLALAAGDAVDRFLARGG